MKTGKSKDHLQRVFLRFLYLIMGSILSLDSVMAQENLKVSGQVTDNKGEAIIGASVKVLKTGTGTISDMDGKFIGFMDKEELGERLVEAWKKKYGA